MDDFGYQCLPNTYEQQQNSNSTTKPYNIHKIYIVYNIYSQYIIPFIIISCAYFRIASHLYFSKPVGQTKHQEVIARNKRKVRENNSNLDKTKKQDDKQNNIIIIIIIIKIERLIELIISRLVLFSVFV